MSEAIETKPSKRGRS